MPGSHACLWRVSFVVAISCIAPMQAQAFKLRPTGTDDERVIMDLDAGFRGRFWSGVTRHIMDHFTHNVHEEITHRIWGCEPPANADIRDTTCQTANSAPPAVIYGVQWSDNPPFKLDSTQTKDCPVNEPIRVPDRHANCWRILFGDAAERAARGEYFRQSNGMALLYRSHFGDMQFLHSMAAWNGATMRDTKANIMMWAEFTYKVAISEIAPETVMSAVTVPGFRGTLGRYWGDVRSLFTYGVPQYQAQIPDVAFGSLLHMVQDSFSKSHVTREYASGTCGESGQPNGGRITEFLAYGSQDADDHGKEDARDKMLANLREQKDSSVVTVSRYLKSLRDAKTPWETVRAYMDRCIYAVADDDMSNPAGPGPYRAN